MDNIFNIYKYKSKSIARGSGLDKDLGISEGLFQPKSYREKGGSRPDIVVHSSRVYNLKASNTW